MSLRSAEPDKGIDDTPLAIVGLHWVCFQCTYISVGSSIALVVLTLLYRSTGIRLFDIYDDFDQTFNIIVSFIVSILIYIFTYRTVNIMKGKRRGNKLPKIYAFWISAVFFIFFMIMQFSNRPIISINIYLSTGFDVISRLLVVIIMVLFYLLLCAHVFLKRCSIYLTNKELVYQHLFLNKDTIIPVSVIQNIEKRKSSLFGGYPDCGTVLINTNNMYKRYILFQSPERIINQWNTLKKSLNIAKTKDIVRVKKSKNIIISNIESDIEVRNHLIGSFNESDIRDVCFELHIDFEDVAGETKSDKARELVLLARRLERSNELKAKVYEKRPHLIREQ